MTDSRIAKAQLGTGGPEVGVQGLGCMGMSFAYGPTDADEARATLERALELGVTLYDTADVYGQGENEKFLVAVLQGAPRRGRHRDQVRPDDPAGRPDEAGHPQRPRRTSGRPSRRACKRLGVDVIDLYYMHRRDVNVPIEETVGAMAELVREGKVKQLGLSEVTGGEAACRAGGAPDRGRPVRVVAVQPGHRGGRGPGGPRTGRHPGPVLPARPGLPHRLLRQRRQGAHRRRLPPPAAPLHRRQRGRERGPAGADPRGRRRPTTPPRARSPWPGSTSRRRSTTCPVIPIPGTRKRTRIEENTAATRIALTEADLALLEPIAAQVVGRPLRGHDVHVGRPGVEPRLQGARGCIDVRRRRVGARQPRPHPHPQSTAAPHSSASNSAFFMENSSSVTQPGLMQLAKMPDPVGDVGRIPPRPRRAAVPGPTLGLPRPARPAVPRPAPPPRTAATRAPARTPARTPRRPDPGPPARGCGRRRPARQQPQMPLEDLGRPPLDPAQVGHGETLVAGLPLRRGRPRPEPPEVHGPARRRTPSRRTP